MSELAKAFLSIAADDAPLRSALPRIKSQGQEIVERKLTIVSREERDDWWRRGEQPPK